MICNQLVNSKIDGFDFGDNRTRLIMGPPLLLLLLGDHRGLCDFRL